MAHYYYLYIIFIMYAVHIGKGMSREDTLPITMRRGYRFSFRFPRLAIFLAGMDFEVFHALGWYDWMPQIASVEIGIHYDDRTVRNSNTACK